MDNKVGSPAEVTNMEWYIENGTPKTQFHYQSSLWPPAYRLEPKWGLSEDPKCPLRNERQNIGSRAVNMHSIIGPRTLYVVAQQSSAGTSSYHRQGKRPNLSTV